MLQHDDPLGEAAAFVCGMVGEVLVSLYFVLALMLFCFQSLASALSNRGSPTPDCTCSVSSGGATIRNFLADISLRPMAVVVGGGWRE